MPALTADSDRGQAALVVLVGGKVGQSRSKRYDLGFGLLQTAQELKPVGSRLDKEFSRPLESLHPVAVVLLTSPAISGRLNDWRANCFANGNVDSLGDHEKLPSVA